jgi:hypothetical protein
MRSLLRPLMLLLLAAAPCAVAAELRPGDQVPLIERDQHIPAHPAPGESRVHLRLVSGSEATVLRVHAATGWIEVGGEALQGSENTGDVAKLDYSYEQTVSAERLKTMAASIRPRSPLEAQRSPFEAE